MEITEAGVFETIGRLYVELEATRKLLGVTQQALEATAKERDTLKESETPT